MEQKKVTVPDILRMKVAGERITMVTAYDCPFARLLDEAGVDILLVGDSLGMVVQGLETTLPVTLDEIVYHTRMVARGRRRGSEARGRDHDGPHHRGDRRDRHPGGRPRGAHPAVRASHGRAPRAGAARRPRAGRA